jgi:O-antigen/teichoic acid export membrane protein
LKTFKILNFYKTAFFTSVYTVINLIAAFITVKVTSKITGPEGSALIGQFTNTTSLISLIATGAINTGVVKYVSEYKHDAVLLKKYIANAFIIILVCSLSMTLFVLCSFKWMGLKAFNSAEFNSVFICYGLLLVINSANSILNSILNGLQEIKNMTIANIAGALINLVLTVGLVIKFGVYGSLLAVVIGQTFIFFVFLYFFSKFEWFNFDLLKNQYDFAILKNYLSYSSTIFIDLTIPFVFLYVRNYIIEKLSLEQAGYWQAMNTLSDRYMSLIYTVLGVYYLPRLAELQEKQAILKEIKWGYIRIIPAVAAISGLVWLLRDFLIQLLLTAKFSPMRDLFIFWTMGNIFGVAWSLISYLLTAKKMIVQNYILYIVFYGSFTLFNIYFIDKHGLIGTGMAYFCNRLFSYSIMLIFFYRLFVKQKKIAFS